MKDAQDAVKEIREWPSSDRELLIELDNGDLQFASEAPGRVVCTKREFMDAKIDQNPTMADAVRALDGDIRRARIRHDHGGLKYSDIVVLKVGGPDRWRVYRQNQILPKGNVTVGTVDGFENEAKRMGYKSDRELWKEMASNRIKAHHWSEDEILSDLYDAMQSGELPMPEKD